jgi:hypothetical protein
MTAALRFFFGKSVVDSMTSFDAELKNYFRASTSFRSRARIGTVVIIDKSPTLYNFLEYLVKKCNLKFCIYHVAEAKDAKKVVAELGSDNIKVVVISGEMLFDSANGATLAQWINEKFPDIPVWISECTPEMDTRIRKTVQRVGIMSMGESLADYADVLGFPSSCREMALKFGT